jgi:FlaA1/EpsC-like NDP-sugar epimerase
MKSLDWNKYLKVLVDAAASGLSLYLAFQIRFEGAVSADDQMRFWTMLFPVIAGRLVSLFLFGSWNRKWRYTTSEDVLRLAPAHGAVMILLLVLRVTVPARHWCVLPLGVIAIDFLLSLMAAVGARLTWRAVCERRNDGVAREPRRLLLIGAGYHGAMIAGELATKKGITVVGFLDDDPTKHGLTIAGHPG